VGTDIFSGRRLARPDVSRLRLLSPFMTGSFCIAFGQIWAFCPGELGRSRTCLTWWHILGNV